MTRTFSKSLKLHDNIFGEGMAQKSGNFRRLPKVARPRWLFLMVLLAIFGLGGLARLADLQLLRGSYFKALADGNRIRRIPIRAARGEILDRNGVSLARNIPSYKLAQFSAGGVVIKTEDIDRETALKLQAADSEEQYRLIVGIQREYPPGEVAAHLIGYVNEATSDEIVGISNDKCLSAGQAGKMANEKLILGDLVGRMGIEKQYDCLLRGVDGEELVEFDTRGRLVRRLGRREPIPGKNIKLTIDARLQEEAYRALIMAPALAKTVGQVEFEGGSVARGALVVQDPQSGGILALVSVPSFDPSTLSQNYSRLAADKNLPMFNRAVGGAYHPGSTFKIVTSIASLEEGKIDKNFTFRDEGVVKVDTSWQGTFTYSNWYFTQYGRTEGEINLSRAISRSTDTFFYKVGEMLGVEKIAFWAQKLGFGKKTGIDLGGEVPGLIPSPEWKQKAKGENWFLGNTYHMAIGQGDVTASPLQVNQMTAVVASGGRLCRPHVIGDKVQPCQSVGLKQETLDILKEGMVGACAIGGTAFPFFNFQPQIACKTGTAQTTGNKTHAWFTAFAPVQAVQGDPLQAQNSIVITALIEDGGEGSKVAAPVVRQVLAKWFEK